MRRKAVYPPKRYDDPMDLRLTSIIRSSSRAMPRAVNILGVPYDGAVLGRRGASGGPEGLRQALAGFSNYSVELEVGLEGARIFDMGDMLVGGGDVERVHGRIQREVLQVLKKDSLLVIFGGDNSVSLPALRAASRKFGKIGLVVVDSHLDLRGKIGGRPTSGSSYGLAIETVGGLDGRRVAEVGIHGFLNSRKYVEKAEGLGVSILTADKVRRSGAKRAAGLAYEIASEGADAVYLSVDLDAVDTGFVTGVSAPSSGGISAAELVEFVSEIGTREKVRCADFVELAPSLDPTGRSQIVGATAFVGLVAGFLVLGVGGEPTGRRRKA
ncbi:MAG: agmatinase family protein [archaeon]|nr:MAG: agmatinase family protein [archaeon]